MARIVVGSYMVRYPLGGMISYVLQYLLGFQRLGHEVYFVEKAGYTNSCFDPSRHVVSDDCTYGLTVVNALLSSYGLRDRWCFVNARERYFGMTRSRVEEVLETADLFLDMGTHGAWLAEATGGVRVLLDGEPGFTQIKMEKRRLAGEPLPTYDCYYTAGGNLGTPRSTAPTAARDWRHLVHPVVTDLFDVALPRFDLPFTTVMNWQSHDPIDFEGEVYGQKDVEFERFVSLPGRVHASLEIAVAGKGAPVQRLGEAGWRVRDAHQVTSSYDGFKEYIRHSRGEFTVCKHIFVATNSGWFSDRSAAYLASGRPVVMQETGFSDHLPTGHGLFAVETVEEAAGAIEAIDAAYENHSRDARELAREYLDASKVLGRFLDELGIGRVGGPSIAAGRRVEI
jgi:hypothetical protein